MSGTGGSNDGVGVSGTGVGLGEGVFGTGGGSGGSGVAGMSGSGGAGVFGTGGGSGAPGVYGVGGEPGGTGVVGNSAKGSGIGVLAQNVAGGGIALKVSGPAVFSRSGLVTVPTGADGVTKTGVSLTSASLVFAIVQEHAPGIYVQAAVPHVAGHSFTVYLSKVVPAPLKVAWFIVN